MNTQKFKIDWSKTMEKIKESNTKTTKNFKDERIYFPEYNSNGVAQAIIRFLPPKDTDLPYVKMFSHFIRGNGGLYIENCPSTIKCQCPSCKVYLDLYKSDKKTADIYKRALSYYSNILVVKDPLHPENEGKVFLFKYGVKIFNKIMEKIQPNDNVDDDTNIISIEDPVMIFDYYEGADFKLIAKKTKINDVEMPNYDSCKFSEPSCIGTDEQIEKIHDSMYNLGDFISKDNFKSFEDLQSKFDRCIGIVSKKDDSIPSYARETTTQPPRKQSKVVEEDIFEGSDDDLFKELQADD